MFACGPSSHRVVTFSMESSRYASPRLVACHECDALYRLRPLRPGEHSDCKRCGSRLAGRRKNGVQRAAAFFLGGAVLFFVANFFPFLSVDAGGQKNTVRLSTAVSELAVDGGLGVAFGVAFFLLVAPLVLVVGNLYILLPLLAGRSAPGSARVARFVRTMEEWAMVEVFFVGVLVSLLKLGALATLGFGVGFWALLAFVPCIAAARSILARHELWARLAAAAHTPSPSTDVPHSDRPSAAARGLACCHACGSVAPVSGDRHDNCPRCNAALHLRKQDSVARTFALTVASLLLYFPAMFLPIMAVGGIQGTEANTILGGVVTFWHHGSYLVAAIIFTASVLIPVAKLIALFWLCFVTRAQRKRQPTEADAITVTKVYRLTELVGRWSMVDVFVVAVLVATVQLGGLMQIRPGGAALAFAGVVVLTMLAALSYDPRLVWDRVTSPEESLA